MKLIQLFFCFFLILHGSLAAQTQMAFFKLFRPDGSLIQLEKNGQFAHSALKVPGGWLHSHPKRGVEIVNELRDKSFDPVGEKNESEFFVHFLSYRNRPYKLIFETREEAIFINVITLFRQKLGR